MPIRKGNQRLQKPCKRCGELFEPSGKYNVICLKCRPRAISSFYIRLQRIQRRKKTGGKND